MKKTFASIAVLGLMLAGPAVAAGYGSSGSSTSSSTMDQSSQSPGESAQMGTGSSDQTASGSSGTSQLEQAPGERAQMGSRLSDQSASGTSGMSQLEPSGQTASLQQDREIVRQVQEQLKSSGYDVGEVDGIYGPQTQQALTQYQKDKGVTASGQIDQELLAGMDIEAPQQASTPDDSLQQPQRDSESFKVQQPAEPGSNR